MTDILYKIVVLGDSGVGKSQLIGRFTQDKFTHESKSTIGVEFAGKDVSLVLDNKTVRGQIWDTAGQERFQAITTAYYRGTQGVLIVYDITKKESFGNLEKWIGEIKKHEPECVVMIAGNKCDLNHMRQIESQDGMEFAKKHNAFFFETSALDNINVSDVFKSLLEEIYNSKKKKTTLQGESDEKIVSKGTQIIKIEHTEDPVTIGGAKPAKKGCCG
jgi:Ras-related protein Rab-11A